MQNGKCVKECGEGYMAIGSGGIAIGAGGGEGLSCVPPRRWRRRKKGNIDSMISREISHSLAWKDKEDKTNKPSQMILPLFLKKVLGSNV